MPLNSYNLNIEFAKMKQRKKPSYCVTFEMEFYSFLSSVSVLPSTKFV